ncbi:baseplate multidomain protein megatron [Microbaculum marinum]|uniref:Glycoside hydrolase/phage tail family protein n=1 Tax=Microbaculum marinum TaxID=1764581 RepID=A0AAW9RRZ2_9HYPH
MATLLLSAAGTALGGPVGGAIGALIGSAIDNAAVAALGPTPHREGPRLTSVDITASSEGAAITRLAGRSRVAGQMIWATRFQELAVTTGGGKGLGGTSTTQYSYYANFAVALCEGPVARIGRIWADGREVDHDYGDVVIRKYLGTEDQDADSLIAAKEGADNAPSYRGIAYVVFESMLLTEYGNRMPIITAEVFRPVGDLEPLVRSVAMIPGTTEFGYDPLTLGKTAKAGSYVTENRTTKVAVSDFVGSLDTLQDLAPNCDSVTLVVAWFGTDLRCGQCEIVPKVENREKVTVYYGAPYPWVAAGQNRLTADLVSQIDGKPAFGGSPNDASVIAAIQEIRSRGLKVMLYPFVIMDVAAGNDLPNPYSDDAAETGQPVYPWRGRITCAPAPGFAGSVDQTAAAASQVSDFAGSATAVHFAASSGFTVAYTGPAEWRYRRFVLHMATLAKLAGGVDAFTIGSEMAALTAVRDGAGGYPFVATLVDLAGEVRSILGGATAISYAADWSEFHSHRPDDGSGDVHFHLDPLWADDDIDFVGIDNYLPAADWRDGTDHLDFDSAGPTSIHDIGYLKANIEGGEHYDWFYAGPADRDGQIRTPITDGGYGKDWVFRNKDIRNWWLNAHHDRPGGIESATPTAWVPQSKPVWFTELGCPAIDKGPNQPNVFHDPKSSESHVPHYSTGVRDDAAQRAYLQAVLEYWADPDNNPASGLYDGRMIDVSRTAIWAWDARMAPSFPQDDAAWADAANWDTGHWISGRLGSAPARETVADLMGQYGFAAFDVSAMAGVVDAVIVDRILSARGVVEAIGPAYLMQAHESEGLIRFRSRAGAPVAADLTLDDLVEAEATGGSERFAKTRAQETELPDVLKLSHGEPANDDQPGEVEARRTAGGSRRVRQLSLPVVMGEQAARAVAETLLHDAWAGREGLELSLPPSLLALDPGDVIRFMADPALGPQTFRISEIADGAGRRLRAAMTEASLFAPAAMPRRSRPSPVVPALGTPLSVFVDGPLLRDGDDEAAGYVAAYLSPWPGGIAFYRSPEDTGFALDTTLPRAARMGELAFDFYSGPAWRWDRTGELTVDLYSGALASATELQVLGGTNALAIGNADGEWEIVQFRSAELVAPDRYRLTMLLRGQRGSEHAMRDPVAAGARVLVLDEALGQPDLSADDLGLPLTWRIGPVNRDVSDASFDQKTVTAQGRGRRPLAPVHLRGRRDHATGDWRLTWIRRTRIGGDSWNRPEVPLGEESEGYVLQILDAPGGSVVRSVTLSEPEYLYTAAQQAADFGSAQWNVPMRVSQVSEGFGAGIPAETLAFDH